MTETNKLIKLEEILQSQQADYTFLKDSVNFKTSEEGAAHYGVSMSETTPTLILKSKDKFFAAIICGDTKIVFKKLKQALGVKDLSMADPETVHQLTGAHVGYVSMINEGLPTVIDNQVLNNEKCFGGCGVRDVSLQINTRDLINITDARLFDFAELKSN